MCVARGESPGERDVGEVVGHRSCRESRGPRRRDHLRAVGNREQRRPHPDRDVGESGVPRLIGIRRVDVAEDVVGERGEQRLLVGKVPVQRVGADTDFSCQPAHREVGEAVVGQDAARGAQDVGAVVAHRVRVSRRSGRNATCTAFRRSLYSVQEFGPEQCPGPL